MAALELRFVPEKETKGTWKFDEVVADGAAPRIGTLYVRKTALDELGHVGGALIVKVEIPA